MADNDQYIKTLENAYKTQYEQIQKIYIDGIKEIAKKYNKSDLSFKDLMIFYVSQNDKNNDQFYKNIYVGTDLNKLNTVRQLFKELEDLEKQLKENNVSISTDIQQNISKKEIESMINDIAQNILDKQLDEYMNTEVTKILSKYNYNLNTQDCINEIKKYIWSFNTAKEKNETELINIQKEINKSITNAIDKATNAAMYKLEQDEKNKLPNFNGYIDTSQKYLNSLKKIDIKKDILTNVQSNLKDGLNSIDSSINKVLGNFDLKVDISGTFSDDIGILSKEITSSFDKYLDPIIKEQNKVIDIAEIHIKEAEELVKEYEAQVQGLINRWEQTAQDYIKQQEQKLVNTIINSINIKF
jgi:hypothetical protein